MMVHGTVRRQKTATAELPRAVTDRTCEAADWNIAQLRELTRKYGVRLPTIADRLGERFVRPLAVDRLRALVRPSVVELRTDGDHTAFSLLEQELLEFTDNPCGSGLDVPAARPSKTKPAACPNRPPLGHSAELNNASPRDAHLGRALQQCAWKHSNPGGGGNVARVSPY
jgi:hypothetical protein